MGMQNGSERPGSHRAAGPFSCHFGGHPTVPPVPTIQSWIHGMLVTA